MPGSDHLGFVWAAYGATALAVAGLVAWAVVDRLAQTRALASLEPDAEAAPRDRDR